MKTYIFEMTHWLDVITAQRFEAIVCWDHCQMFYQPIYYVRTIAESDKPCPFCQLQQWPGWGQTDPQGGRAKPCVDAILAAAKEDDTGQLSLFGEAA